MSKPKLRFPEFTGDWVQHILSDVIVDIADGPFGSNLKLEHYTDKKEARIIQLSNLSDYGWQEENTRYTTFEHAETIKRCIVNEDELIMGKMMPAGMTIMRPTTDKMYVLSSDCVRIKLDKSIATNEFFLYTTKSEEFLNQIRNSSQGSTRIRTSISKIKNMNLNIPSLPEQQKIGFLFTKLDALIQSAEKELEGYRELKKGMLQKMFPKKGEKVPEVRFPEFTGDWEQHKLGEVAPLRGGYAFKSDKYKTEGTPIVRISNILSDGSVGAEFAYYDDIEDDEKCTLGNGDALLAMSGATTGKVSILKCNNNDKYYQNQRVGYFERNEQYNYGFVSTIVRSDLFKEQLTLVLVAGAQPNVSSKEIDAFEFMFPNSIVEQKKIGEYFSNLDNLIALQQQELDGYKELKKGLLQQMFC